MTEAETIAGELNPLQRAGVVRASPFGFGAWLLPIGTGRGLTGLGVAKRTIDGMCLTPLGLAVRASILATEREKE